MKKLLVLFFACSGFLVQAQKYELGEVTKEELAEKAHPTDPSAPAAILFSKGETFLQYSVTGDNFELVTEVEMKIKIYNKEGYDWANKTMKYYNDGQQKEMLDFSKAVTYNLVDGKIEKTKLKSDGEFTEEVNKYWKAKKIMMPDVKEGSIIEYKYVVRSPFISTFPDWQFQESIPVNHSEYTTKIPEYFIYNPNFRGYYTPTVTNDAATRSFSITSKERTGTRAVRTTFTTDKIDYREAVTKYVLNNLEALKDESYVNNIANYSAAVEHELSIIKYPNSPIKTISTNWDDVAKTIYKYDDFGPELDKTGYYDEDIDALLAGITSPAEKAYTIFFYVKSRMNWNGFVGYSCEQGVKKAYKEKVGNVADINLMLTSMLRYAGLDANPVLVSTRANKIALFPSRSAFNYVIATVNIEGANILFDATSKQAMPNILPTRTLNWEGRLIKKDGSSEPIALMPYTPSREVIMVTAELDKEGKLSGKARDQYFDYNAYIFRDRYENVKKESYIEKMEADYTGLELIEYEVEHDDPSKPVIETYAFNHNNTSEIIGDKIYINPLLFFARTENPFKLEKRQYPIDFVFPTEDKFFITITLPEGYEVESLPEPLAMSMEQNIGGFKYNIAQSNNKLQIIATVNINYATIPPDYYDTVKHFYQQMVDKQKEKIVLKKAL
ncbi:DUF3857 domain-containing protein [Flavobacterium rhizosphaerae]|uniref:DUF3857 domain-containing protein n=1 Tax=Flavobacterium rhizosphaerae TaxID=3163298 RepID=A0ABW8YV15_9FLAO